MGRAGTAGERVRYADRLNGKFYWENGRQWGKGERQRAASSEEKRGKRESAPGGGGIGRSHSLRVEIRLY